MSALSPTLSCVRERVRDSVRVRMGVKVKVRVNVSARVRVRVRVRVSATLSCGAHRCTAERVKFTKTFFFFFSVHVCMLKVHIINLSGYPNHAL